FRDTLVAAFRHRRKTLANSLRPAWGRERTEAALAASGLEGRRRAESLGLEEFARLHQVFLALGE
ncbi:MAG: 16S rRNA (adenine(1518)-N(6)/adenine(1519)-N(6))-dimethyltransferase, partial [Acidobacteria bacterium]|nr:16S rRNA (adenine(1518)-N(6)/adenine(1519)-N(6))-dimethyltransferase [Acidobacteriota bacterium]